MNKITEQTDIPISRISLSEVADHKIVTFFDVVYEEAIMNYGINENTQLFAYEILNSIESACEDGKSDIKKRVNPEEAEIGDYLDVQVAGSYRMACVIDVRENGEKELNLHIDNQSSAMDFWLVATDTKIKPIHTSTYPISTSVIKIYLNNVLMNGGIETIGFPLVISIGNWYTYQDLHEVIFKSLRHYVRDGYKGKQIGQSTPIYKINPDTGRSLPYTLKLIDVMGNNCSICKSPTCRGCELPYSYNQLKWLGDNSITLVIEAEWQPDSYNFDPTEEQTFKQISQERAQVAQELSLEHCLTEFTKAEQIDNTCEKCQQKNTQQMQVSIWRLPDILIICLKRFTFNGGTVTKISSFVNFPIYCLDLSEWVGKKEAKEGLTLSTTTLQRSYDLFGVINHSGTMSGGHYTVYCLDGEEWMYVDDDNVYKTSESVATDEAYLLFYRRRKFASSNVINMTY